MYIYQTGICNTIDIAILSDDSAAFFRFEW